MKQIRHDSTRVSAIEMLEARQLLALSFSPLPTTGSVSMQSIDTDAAGNVYAVGVFSGQTTFDKAGKIKLTAIGDQDGFVMRVAAKDNATIVRRFSASSAPQGTDNIVSPMKVIAQDGHVTVTGQFSGRVDLDPGKGTKTFVDSGAGDVFMVDLTASNLALNWATTFGGTGSDSPQDLDRDSAGNTWVAGYFQKTLNFRTTPARSIKSAGGFDSFAAKFGPTGAYLFSARVGAAGDDLFHAVAVDAKDNVFIGGQFQKTVDTNPGSAKANLTSAGASTSGLVIELNSAGAFKASRGLLGTGFATVTDLEIDSKNAVYTLVNFDSTLDVDPTSKTTNLVSKGAGDIALVKFDNALTKVWHTTFGAASTDQGQDLYIDSKNQIALCGTIQQGSTDLDPSKGKAVLATQGEQDGFVSVFSAAGKFQGAVQLRGAGAASVYGTARSGSKIVAATLFVGALDLVPLKLPGGSGTPSLFDSGDKLDSVSLLIDVSLLGST